MAMKEFEDCLAYIEHQLGIQLFGWQKEVLKRYMKTKKWLFVYSA